MRLLLTNDDGIHAPGLRVLAGRLQADGHELTVLAPDRQYSGSGTSVGSELNGALVRVQPIRLAGLPKVRALMVGGPPALVALAACHGLVEEQPELVVSGINPGHNVGRLVLHSGTLGAAITAAAFGWRAVAVSCPPGDDQQFEAAADFIASVLDVLASRAAEGPVLNINFPHCALADVRGVRRATLVSPAKGDLTMERTRDGLRVHVSRDRADGDENTDLALLHARFITVTSAPTLRGRELQDEEIADDLDRQLGALSASRRAGR